MAVTQDPSHHLHDEDFDVDQGVDSNITCEACWEKVKLNETVILISAKQAFVGHLNTVQVIDLLNDDGDYEIDPLFIHEECWAEQVEELMESMEDQRLENRVGTPGKILSQPDFIFRCDSCESPIEPFERHVHALVGRVVVVRLGAEEFEAAINRDPAILCIHCANWMDVNCFERWTDEDGDSHYIDGEDE